MGEDDLGTAGGPVIEPPAMKKSPFLGLIYVEDEILLTGQQESIERVIGEFGLKLGYGEEQPIPLGEGRTIRLATIEVDDQNRERSVEEVTCLFNAYAATNPGVDAAADPNYFISPAWRGGG